MGHVQTYYGMEEICPIADGKVVVACAKQGANVVKGQIVAFIKSLGAE